MKIGELEERFESLFVEDEDFDLEAFVAEFDERDIGELLNCITAEPLWDEDAPGGGMVPVRASKVVGECQPDEALSSLYLVLHRAPIDSILYEEVSNAIKAYGDEAIAAGVHALKEYGEPFREDLACLFAELGIQKRVVFQVILKHFVENPHLGAHNLAEYGDPQGVDALEVVLDRYLVAAKEDPDVAETIEAIADAIEQLGGELKSQHRDDVEEIRAKKRKSREIVERVKQGKRPGEQGEDTVVHEKDIGRNDACWCGSGQKYKYCHWAEDNRDTG